MDRNTADAVPIPNHGRFAFAYRVADCLANRFTDGLTYRFSYRNSGTESDSDTGTDGNSGSNAYADTGGSTGMRQEPETRNTADVSLFATPLCSGQWPMQMILI